MTAISAIGRGLFIGLLTLVAAQAAPAIDSKAVMKLAADKPEADNWIAFGKGETHWLKRDASVQGGLVLHVVVDAKQKNAWDTQAVMATSRDIAKGDGLLFAFWARAETPASNLPPTAVTATVQGNDAPYPVMGKATLIFGPEWKLTCVAGTSTKDFKTGKFAGVLQVGNARQTLDLGPAFLFAARTPAERKLIAAGCTGLQSAIAAVKIAPPSIATLKKKLEKILADTGTPGMSVAIVRKDGVEWTAGLGKANVAHNVPATADTLFRIGSTSKTFAALSVLKLAGEGKLPLMDPVRKLAPEVWFENKWEATDPVRVVDLLAHTTGWDDLHLTDYVDRGEYTDLGKQLDLVRASRVSRWRPGTRMSYCNSGPVVAAYIVQKITGRRFEDYVTENFFRPMGMTTATYDMPDPKLAVTLYHADGKTPFPYWHISGRPAGSINASAKDMAQLVLFYLNRGSVNGKQIAPAADIDRMETPSRNWAAEAGLKDGYGLANYTSVYDGRLWHGHNGGVMGGITDMAYLPKAGVGYFYSLNAIKLPTLMQIGKAIRDYLTIDIPPEPMPKAAPLPPDANAGWYKPASVRNSFMQGLADLLNLRLVRVKDGALVVSALGEWNETYLPVSGSLFRRDKSPIATVALLPPEPEGRFIQFAMNDTAKRVPTWLAYTELVLVAWFLLALVSIVLYTPCWLIWGIWKRHRRPQERWLKLWPLIALLSLVAFGVISAFTGEDAIERLGNLTLWSGGLFLTSLMFGVASLASAVSLWLKRRGGVRKFVYGYSVAVSLALVIATVYLAWWGFIGIRMWA